MTAKIVIRVPNVLGGTPETAEIFLSHLSSIRPARPIVLDLSKVSWICPYGAILLLGVCRYLTQFSREKVAVAALPRDVHAYLRRIDFFERASDVAYTLDRFDPAYEWSRNAESSSVLELVPISALPDVYQVGIRARKILGYWLRNATADIDRIVSLLSEACSNVVDHSCDVGVVTIQKYEHGRNVDVQLAISDLGIGQAGAFAQE